VLTYILVARVSFALLPAPWAVALPLPRPVHCLAIGQTVFQNLLPGIAGQEHDIYCPYRSQLASVPNSLQRVWATLNRRGANSGAKQSAPVLGARLETPFIVQDIDEPTACRC